jgi:hypothetical protein
VKLVLKACESIAWLLLGQRRLCFFNIALLAGGVVLAFVHLVLVKAWSVPSWVDGWW